MHILVADDDPGLSHILAAALRSVGHEVTTVSDGDRAWEAWQHGHPRMVITDWMMPHANGLELVRRIREAGWASYTYVILLTVRGMKEDVVQGLENGADDYLTKPFDLAELQARVRAGERILQVEAELSEARDHLEALATNDVLTGLLNRRALETHAHAELSRARRGGYPLSLVMLDVDGFKVINDRYGHQEGDRALQIVAEVLNQNKRPYDWAGRWGGDEFVVLLPRTALTEAGVVAERLRASLAVAKLLLSGGDALPLQASLGVASTSTWRDGPQDFSVLMEQVDRALYTAKRGGRNRVALDQ